MEECLLQKYGKRKYHKVFHDKPKTCSSKHKYHDKEENKNAWFKMYLADELKRNKPNNWLEEDIDFSEVPPIISPPR